MSKAEDLSRQYVLPFLDKQYEKYGKYRQMVLSRFDGYDMMSAYEEGYHQAEKDLELTLEDMFTIFHLINEVLDDDFIEGKTKKEIGEEALPAPEGMYNIK